MPKCLNDLSSVSNKCNPLKILNQQQARGPARLVKEECSVEAMTAENSTGREEEEQLPENWERALTQAGEPYFIDHSTGTSQWLDPRVDTKADEENELPYGWEKIDDPHYGTYYIDHVNKRTQYENPVAVARKISTSSLPDAWEEKRSLHSREEPPRFTADPSRLQGVMVGTRLVKGARGFGFTLVGGDRDFLQVKAITPHGPAWVDGKLAVGDVVVRVCGRCVLGLGHSQAVALFQSISPGDAVLLDVCRGYPLPPEDPDCEVVLTNGVSLPDLPSAEEETVVDIVKGKQGFGFTIADSVHGQKVKKIVDGGRCGPLLREGDVLVRLGGVPLRGMPHAQVVQLLKECPCDAPARIHIRRRIKSTTEDLGDRASIHSAHGFRSPEDRSKTPTTDLMHPLRTAYSATLDKATANPSWCTTLGKLRDPRSASLDDVFLPPQRPDSVELVVTLPRREGGFGFRVVGGTEEGSEVCVGHVVAGGAADGHLRPGDEIVSVDGLRSVSHHRVVQLIAGGAPPTLTLRLRRKVAALEQHDVTLTLTRHDGGFGFVLISSSHGGPPTIGRIVEGSPAAGRLRVGDRIVRVNGTPVRHLHHGETVRLIKECGPRITLTIGGPEEEGAEYHAVELRRGPQGGFGFSIRGGLHHMLPLFVLRIAEGGPAHAHANLLVGDQIIEINGQNTKGMGHEAAIRLIRRSQQDAVRLLVLRRGPTV